MSESDFSRELVGWIALACNSLKPNLQVMFLFMFEQSIENVVTIRVARPRLLEGTSDGFTVREQNNTAFAKKVLELDHCHICSKSL